MTPSNAAPRQKRGAAARSEVSGKPKTITIRGQKFTLPNSVKARVWRDMVEASEGNAGRPTIDILEEVLGEQMERFWDIDVSLNGTGMIDGLADLMNDAVEAIMGAYGTSAGESAASSKS